MLIQKSESGSTSLRTAGLPPDLEALARRFAAPVRREVRRLLRSCPRHGDLAIVFPGALHALAAREMPLDSRLEAHEMVRDGAPLKTIAQALELPLWLRRLPPEAFRNGIPELPRTETFARRIANRLPERRRESATWLAAIAFAARAAHEDFAVWLAEQEVFSLAGPPERTFGVLAAYAWYSRAHGTAANRLILVPWRAEMGLDTALCSAKSWLNRLRLQIQLKPGTITDTWLAPGAAGGYSFHTLTTAAELLAEAHAMHNCADQYADRLARDKCRLFAVRRGGQSVATIEIGPHQREVGVLAITQLKGRHNMPAPNEVWQAAHAWFAGQPTLRRPPVLVAPSRPLDGAEWASLMRPYRSARDGAPWLPGELGIDGLVELDAQMIALARHAGVTSWLFT